MTQTIEQLIAELRDEEIHTFDGFTVADVLEQLTARVRELEEQRDELAKALSLTIDCWECEAFLTDEVVNISREALSVFEG